MKATSSPVMTRDAAGEDTAVTTQRGRKSPAQARAATVETAGGCAAGRRRVSRGDPQSDWTRPAEGGGQAGSTRRLVRARSRAPRGYARGHAPRRDPPPGTPARTRRMRAPTCTAQAPFRGHRRSHPPEERPRRCGRRYHRTRSLTVCPSPCRACRARASPRPRQTPRRRGRRAYTLPQRRLPRPAGGRRTPRGRPWCGRVGGACVDYTPCRQEVPRPAADLPTLCKHWGQCARRRAPPLENT